MDMLQLITFIWKKYRSKFKIVNAFNQNLVVYSNKNIGTVFYQILRKIEVRKSTWTIINVTELNFHSLIDI